MLSEDEKPTGFANPGFVLTKETDAKQNEVLLTSLKARYGLVK